MKKQSRDQSSSTRSYRFEIETAIATWRQFLSRDRVVSIDDLDELEDHLRFELETLRSKNLSNEESFRIALKRVGDMAEINSAFRYVIWEKHMLNNSLRDNVMAALGLLSSYITAAWNGIARQKGYALLNVAGLAIALSACIIIALYVRNELSYDSFHAKADRVYRLEMQNPRYAGENKRSSSAVWAAADGLSESIPEIEVVARLSSLKDPLVQVGEHRFFEEWLLFTTPEFFEIFDFDFSAGGPGKLATPNTVVLSASMAAKYFPDGDALAQIIQISSRSASDPDEYEIVGVFKDIPSTSHFDAEFIASQSTRGEIPANARWSRTAHTYLLLNPLAELGNVRNKLDVYWTNNIRRVNWLSESSGILQPLRRIHLHSTAMGELEPQGDIKYVMMFVLAAILLLVVACVNYVNLSVARYAGRAKEVGIRKVVGANRGQLIWQFLGESLVYCAISFVAATVMVILLLPAFNAAMDLSLNLGTDYRSILLLALPTIVVVGILSGGYPALFLSRFAPVSVFKGELGSGRRAVMRKGLLIFQFVITSGLIIGTIVISEQMRFVQDQKFGAVHEQILLLKTQGAFSDNAATFRDKLSSVPGVESVSFASGYPGYPSAISFYRAEEIENFEGDDLVLEFVWVDTAYARTLSLALVQGEFFSADRVGDSANGIVLNEKAVETIGWTDPIGKRMEEGDDVQTVIGVVRDFHSKSMYEDIMPLMLQIGSQTNYTGLRVSTSNLRQTLDEVRLVWERFIPGRPFDYSFLDDDFKAMYRKETRLGNLFSVLSVLTMIIAVLGLFGLVSFSAQQRTKEIGIRKTLGATASNITLLLSREFAVLVVVSFILATPAIFWIMKQWLSQFAYRIELEASLFLFSGVFILAVAMLAVGLKAVRVAQTAPVEYLREE